MRGALFDGDSDVGDIVMLMAESLCWRLFFRYVGDFYNVIISH